MNKQDLEIFKILKYNESKKYWYYIVSTNVRRSGEMKISNKRYNILKKQHEALQKQNGA